MKIMTVMRGVSGSGKSTTAHALATRVRAHVVSADDYFMIQGEYVFDPSKIVEAHMDCQRRVREVCEHGLPVVVDNTNTQRWELQPYFDLAARYGYNVVVVSVETDLSDEALAQRNKHGVPLVAIQRMREAWEANWQAGDPRPPWER